MTATWDEPGDHRAIRAAIEQHIERYDAPRPVHGKRGRPTLKHRDELLDNLETAFRKHSHWDTDHYDECLETFLRCVLIAYKIPLPDTRLRRTIRDHRRRA